MKTKSELDQAAASAAAGEQGSGPSPAVHASGLRTGHGSAVMDEQTASLLTELARALQRQSMYPVGHPALSGTSAALADVIGNVLGDRTQIAIQVGPSQLAVDGALTNEDNPALSSLAGQLHRHAVAILSISRQVQADEIDELLRALALDPLGQEASPLAGRSWSHVRITFVHYDQLALDEEEDRPPSGELGGVWLALASSARAGEEVGHNAGADAVRLAHDIEAHSPDQAYAREVVTHLLEIERAIESAPVESVELRKLASDLVSHLDPETIQRLLNLGTSADQRRELLEKAQGSLNAGAVIKLMRGIAQLENYEIPHPVWLVLSKLAHYAEQGDRRQRSGASRLVRDQALQLLENWDVSSFTPRDYANVLETMSANASNDVEGGSGRSRASVEHIRTVQMGIEIGRPARSVLESFARLVGEGAIEEILDLLDAAPSDNPAVAELCQRIKEPNILGSLLEAEAPDFDLIDRMVAMLGFGAVEPMLDALASADSRSVRSQLFRRLAALGAEIAPRVATRLDDDRWYVRRNMLALLDELGGMPSGFTAATYLEDEAEGVRLMAIKLLLREPDQRERAVAAALDSSDSRTVITGLVSARDDCPDGQVLRIVELALDGRNPREIRVHATRALKDVRREEAIEALLRLARQKRGTAFWRKAERLPAVAIEAHQILRSTWAADPRAGSVLGRRRGAEQGRGKPR